MSWVTFRSKPLAYHRRKLFDEGYRAFENDAGRAVAVSPRQRVTVGMASRALSPLRYLRRAMLGAISGAFERERGSLADGYMVLAGPPGYERMIEICEQQLAIFLDWRTRGEKALNERGIPVAAYTSEANRTATDP